MSARKHLIILLVLSLLGNVCGGGRLCGEPLGEEPLKRGPEHVQVWRDAKFGLFIHWGLYSLPAGVWEGEKITGKHPYAEHIQMRLKIPNAEYAKLAGQFNPVQFDAGEWVALAKEAGMRHIVITAKHQDGFALYDSTVSKFDIIDATPFKRDPMRG